MMKRLLWVIVLVGSWVHVQAHTEQQVLTQEQMVNILVDLELAKAEVAEPGNTDQAYLDATFLEQVDAIYHTHDTDATTFKNSYWHYLNEPALMLSIYEQVINALAKCLDEA